MDRRVAYVLVVVVSFIIALFAFASCSGSTSSSDAGFRMPIVTSAALMQCQRLADGNIAYVVLLTTGGGVDYTLPDTDVEQADGVILEGGFVSPGWPQQIAALTAFDPQGSVHAYDFPDGPISLESC